MNSSSYIKFGNLPALCSGASTLRIGIFKKKDLIFLYTELNCDFQSFFRVDFCGRFYHVTTEGVPGLTFGQTLKKRNTVSGLILRMQIFLFFSKLIILIRDILISILLLKTIHSFDLPISAFWQKFQDSNNNKSGTIRNRISSTCKKKVCFQ